MESPKQHHPRARHFIEILVWASRGVSRVSGSDREEWEREAGTTEALRKENEGLGAKLVALAEGNERLNVKDEVLRAKLVLLGEENERLRVRMVSLESEREARELGRAREREGRAEEVDSLRRENVKLKRKNEVLE